MSGAVRRAVVYTARRMADRVREYAGEGTRDPAIPGYVAPGEEERWANAGTVAANLLGLPEEHEQVWSMRRVIFHDRENYPD